MNSNDYYTKLNLEEQRCAYPENIARNPDNLKAGQMVFLGKKWITIVDMTRDRYNRITVAEPGVGAKRMELDSIRFAAAEHRHVEELRKAENK